MPDALVIAPDLLTFRKALWTVNRNIHALGCAIHDQFGHAQSHRRGKLETRAAHTALEIETFRSGLPKHRMLIGSNAIVATVGSVQIAMFHNRYALADAVDGTLDEALDGVVGVTFR